MKPRYKRRIFWTTVSVLATGALTLVIAPSFVNLNNLKPKIQTAIFEQTGLNTKIDGNVNFSLLGGATIVAHHVMVDNGTLEHVLFSVPISKIFNLDTAELTGRIFIYGAKFDVSELVPPKFDNKIDFKDSIISFKGKDYEIIQGTLSNGMLNGIVRTNQHKYEFDSNGDEFHITNKNNNLEISGHLYSDGSARGKMSIDTPNVNQWFEFDEPKINERVKLTMDFDWNGDYGFKFSNIIGDNFYGEIELFDDGRRNIELTSNNADFDLSFLLAPTGVFRNTAFNLDLNGNLKFADLYFNHVKIDAVGTTSQIFIRNITADDITINGGTVNANGAENMPIRIKFDDIMTYCLFSGSPTSWKCADFTHGDLVGSLSVENNKFEVFVQSNKKMPNNSDLIKKTKLLGDAGRINFQFADIGGTITVNKNDTVPSYRFAKNKPLSWLRTDLVFLPDSMKNAVGDFVWDDNGMSFIPHSNRWKLSLTKDFFHITGKNAKEWFTQIDLQSFNDFEYKISGNYKKSNISNLEIEIAGHTFTGSAIGNSITLKTELFNIDTFISQDFIDNYGELQFLTADPLMIPFMLDTSISLSADTVIYNGDDFTNFVYSLRNDRQSFSVTDNRRGNLLTSITKEHNKYKILLQLNKFSATGGILSSLMPINIFDTVVTGQATLATHGQIAYDIWYNMSGKIDMAFDGGYINGLGIDNFYANSQNITTLNAEFMLADALENGDSVLKNLHFIGDYNGGNFTTTTPFSLSLRHADATGTVTVNDGKMAVSMNLIMRGTSPLPAPIAMDILPSGRRDYSLSQIMINFDPDYFRDFVATHDKF